jgi:transposase
VEHGRDADNGRRRYAFVAAAAALGRSRGGLTSKVHLSADRRNTAERCINRIKEWRGLAFRFDKNPGSYLAGLHLRGAILWVRSLQTI